MKPDVLLAAVIGAQGLKGAVKAKIFIADPDALVRYGVLHDAKGRTYEITAFRSAKPGEAVISFKGIADRHAAEALKGTELFVARGALPATQEDEFYHADLIARGDGNEVLLAFTRETVPQIDIAGGRIQIAVPEDDEGNDHVE